MFGNLEKKAQAQAAMRNAWVSRERPRQRFARWLELVRLARPLVQNALAALDDFETRITKALEDEKKHEPAHVIMHAPAAMRPVAFSNGGALTRPCPKCGHPAPAALHFLGNELTGCSSCSPKPPGPTLPSL